MSFRFTKHAVEKLELLKNFDFSFSESQIQEIIRKPLRIEKRFDNTYIASSVIDKTHILRIVYRHQGDIIVIITFYPGRRKAYGL